MAAEFDLINQYFRFSKTKDVAALLDVQTGIGDDAAVLNVNSGKLVVATDTLVEGVHFPKAMEPQHLASRALSVNLSDFAAMGVKPKWLTLSLCMPNYDEVWIAAFAGELAQLCRRYSLALVGGDTVRGNLCIGFTVMGMADGQYLLRSGAQVEDDLWVSGNLGSAAAALALLENTTDASWAVSEVEKNALLDEFYKPIPRIELGLSLRNVATSAIDISDGLLGDARHLARASGVGLSIDSGVVPVTESLSHYPDSLQLRKWVMRGGDDYELLFTAAKEKREHIASLQKELNIKLSRIGSVFNGEGLLLDGIAVSAQESAGYSHF